MTADPFITAALGDCGHQQGKLITSRLEGPVEILIPAHFTFVWHEVVVVLDGVPTLAKEVADRGTFRQI